jgi:hypothetical protein
MSGVKRYDWHVGCGSMEESADGYWVTAEDYDTLRAANHRLETELANLKEDRDQQYDMKVKAREQRDAMTAAKQRLEGDVARLREVAREFAGYWSSDNPKHWELHGLADGADYSDALRGNGGE